MWLLRLLLARHPDIENSAFSCLAGLAYIVLIVSRTPALSYVAVYIAAWYVGTANGALRSERLSSVASIPKSVSDSTFA